MKSKLLFVLFLYVFLFSPPVAIGSVRLYLDWLLWPIAFTYIVGDMRKFKSYLKTFSPIFQILVYLLIYSFFRGLLSGELSTFISNLFAQMRLIVVPYFLIRFGEKFCNSVNDYVKYILIAVTLAVGISMLAVVFPSVDNLIRYQIIKYRENEIGIRELQRGFGFGSELTSQYSYVIAMVVALGLFFRGYKWFYLVIPFAILACLLNARTGIVVIFGGIVTYILTSGKFSFSKIAGSILVVFLGLSTWVYLEDILEQLGASTGTIRWIMTFTEEVDMISSGEANDTTLGYLWNKMFILPKDFGWLVFGNGYSLFGGHITDYGRLSSDIGFTNQLSFGGILYAIPLYYLVFKVSNGFNRHHQKSIGFFIIIAFFIINYKGVFVVNTATFALTLLIFYLSYIYDRRMKQNDRTIEQLK